MLRIMRKCTSRYLFVIRKIDGRKGVNILTACQPRNDRSVKLISEISPLFFMFS